MDYISPKDQEKHNAITMSILHERRVIAQHHNIIKMLQERLLLVGTEDEQATKRLKLSAFIAQMDNKK